MLSCCKNSNKFFYTDNSWTLYPKNFFDDKILQKKKILKNLKNPQTNVIGYDDAWINFNRIKKNIKVAYARPYSIFFKPASIFYRKKMFSLGQSCKGRWREAEVFDRLIKNSVLQK